MSDAYPQVEVTSRAELRAWLAEHHATSPGIWPVTHKQAEGDRHVPYDDVVREVPCVGWVDSRPRKVDARRSALLLTPRRPGSGWSKANKERVAELEAAGLLQPAGVRAIEAAKADGSWTALDAAIALIEPDDLREALDATPVARAEWDAFPPSARRAIGQAKRPETRARRVTETVEQAAIGVRANQWRQPKGR